ncbi:hypothetical protein FDECE_3675 [Fusarium decemcellulare]|nr:hypothetical protein FDECE_3675 [Fusarium decemcellulare]
MEPDRPRKPRQGHRKSRNGCAVCKKRHIKCDERRPKCGNCEISERQCFYVSPKKAKVGASPYEQELTTSAWLQTASTSTDEVAVASPDLHSLEPDDLFTFEHLNLLYHVQENITEWMMVTEQLKPLANVYVTAALKTPYLMNQLLALSAMNLRTIDTAKSDSYTQAAAHLRHRALRGFNRAIDDTSQANATSQFFFASLLALHYLAETVTVNPDQDFSTTLRCTLEYFRLHRGARVMSDRAYPTFAGSPISQWLLSVVRERREEQSTPSEECSLLFTMLNTSDLNEESRRACEEAAQAFDFVVRKVQGPNGWGVHGLLAWSNLIPLRFLTLLEKQIPEALVILAHYAVLMHRFRAFWCLGDVGERLVDGITSLLATYWGTWLPSLEVE